MVLAEMLRNSSDIRHPDEMPSRALTVPWRAITTKEGNGRGRSMKDSLRFSYIRQSLDAYMPQGFCWPWPHDVLANHEAPPRVVMLDDLFGGPLGILCADAERQHERRIDRQAKQLLEEVIRRRHRGHGLVRVE